MTKLKGLVIEIHSEDERGNVCTLQNRHGLLIKWNGERLLVPRGFESDGASVPRLFWRLVFPTIDPQALRAAIAHDYIYRTQPEGWEKEDADEMFYDLLIEDGVPKWRAWIAYQAVRLCGWCAWHTKGGLANGNSK